MENKLPEHIAEKISKEADAYELSQKGNHESSWFGYYNGSISWADKCQQLAEALKGILLFCETNGEPCDGYRFREEVQNARKLLATWNEGKPEKQQNKR